MTTTAINDLPGIAARVRKLRTERGWRQHQLADAAGAGVSVRTIQVIESGAYRARDSTYGRIAQAFGVTLDHLLAGEV